MNRKPNFFPIHRAMLGWLIIGLSTPAFIVAQDWEPPAFPATATSQPGGASQPGGVLQIQLPEMDSEVPALPDTTQATSTPSLPNEFDAMVRQADFSQPIEPIPDPATSPTTLSPLPAAQKQVSGILANLTDNENLTQLKGSLAQVDFPKVAGSLAIVLGVYFAFIWLTRQIQGTHSNGLPKEVVEVLGFAPFGPKQNLQLVRLGSKLLLLLHGVEGTRSIGEISDPEEVEFLAGLCKGRKSDRVWRRNESQTGDTSATPSPAANTTHRVPEVSIPANEIENVVRRLAASSQSNGRNVFEA